MFNQFLARLKTFLIATIITAGTNTINNAKSTEVITGELDISPTPKILAKIMIIPDIKKGVTSFVVILNNPMINPKTTKTTVMN